MRLLALLSLFSIPALATTAGPDSAGVVLTDSAEFDGPAFVWLDATAGAVLAPATDGLVDVALPFGFEFYGTAYKTVSVSENGALFFENGTGAATGDCPGGTTAWTGVAALWQDLSGGSIHTTTFGTYPYRTFVVSWDGVGDATFGGTASVQVWLLEGRNEVAVVHADNDFGAPAVDGGAAAVVGVSSGATGLSWSCATSFAAEQTVWFGLETGRPARRDIYEDELDEGISGAAAFGYVGRSLLASDLNSDGIDDLFIGAPSASAGSVYQFYRPWESATVSEAESSFSGATSGDSFGTAFAAGDHDGDGTQDIAISAPDVMGSQPDAGAVYLFDDAVYAGAYLATDAAFSLSGTPTGQGGLGRGLAVGDLDGDGYSDLAAGAPDADPNGENSGEVRLVFGSATLSGTVAAADADVHLYGEMPGDGLGSALKFYAAGTDTGLVVSSPFADAGGVSTGTVYLVPHDVSLGSTEISTAASAWLNGENTAGRLGATLAAGDMDGNGFDELFFGAPRATTTASNAGLVLAYADGATTGWPAISGATGSVRGLASSARLSDAMVTGDVDGDGLDDLVLGAPNESTYYTGGGVSYVFTSMPTGVDSTVAADHRIIGSYSSGGSGSSLAVASDGAGEGGSLIVGAPTASGAATGSGNTFTWSYAVNFEDDDDDGFVNVESGGNDCDDNNADAFPGQVEVIGDLGSGGTADTDCDGWIDAQIKVRESEDTFDWDVENELRGTPVTNTFVDFESVALNDAVASIGEVSFTSVTASDVVSGTFALGNLAASSDDDALTLGFARPIEALSVRFLDPNDDFAINGLDEAGNVVVDQIVVDLSADDRSGGLYRGFTFAEPVSEISFTALTGDVWGIDDLTVVFAADTDTDGDGFTETGGDCDDLTFEINPDALEILNNGVDDDCDGEIDGGNLTLVPTESEWVALAPSASEEVDFEAIFEGESISDQYDALGANFTGGPVGAPQIDTALAFDTMAASSENVLAIYFTELQPFVALSLLGLDGTVNISGYADGVLLYTQDYTPGSDVAFVGMVFDLGVDELILTNATDTFGIDNLLFSPLGSDDADGDGYTESSGDCDDTDAAKSPDEAEIWYDGVDTDCDGGSDYDQDGDGDDQGGTPGTDCDDLNAFVGPTQAEIYYDGFDTDCSGGSDYDADSDGHDAADSGGTDCADGDAAISPDATEVWYDGVDQNCDGGDDFDADGDGYSVGTGIGETDCDDNNAAANPGEAEDYYDGANNDCDDATVDADADGDGFNAIAVGGDDCDDTAGFVYPGAPADTCYDGVDQDCDGWSESDCDRDGFDAAELGGADCDDADPGTNPSATDIRYDGIDHNCDGAPEFDYDNDGYDAATDGGTDCDDENASFHPGAEDTCYDGVDHDCDGVSDNDCDHDGHDDLGRGGDDCDDTDATLRPSADDFPYDGIDHNCDGADEFDADGDGHSVSWYGGDDCDDADATVAPGAIDACYDGIDSDCAADDDYDCDTDGATSIEFGGDDCDDADDSVLVGAPETADDGIDQDCDGSDLVTCSDCDADGDLSIADGGTDCDDLDATTYVGALDLWYDGIDSDCAGDDDYDQDVDGDRAKVVGGADCNDANANVGPHVAADTCGAGDEDCDGTVDEDCIGDTGDSGDTGDTGDTGEDSGETGTPEDTANDETDDWRPEASEPDPARVIEPESACGCNSQAPAGAAGLVLAAVTLSRRRRSGRSGGA